MASLHLTLLGGFEAQSLAGAPVSLPTKKSQALLAYLALPPGKWHTRDELMGLLWSDRSEEQARNSLRQALSALRKSLHDAGADALVAERDRIGLEPEAVEVDVQRLEERAGGTNGGLEEIATLYRGDFLEGLSIRDPACEEWLRHERARLRRLAVDALARLSEAQMQSGAAEHAVATAQRLLDLDPVYEPAYRTLMRLYAARGQRAFALKTYQTCCSVLGKELEVEPEAATRELFEAIRDGEISIESSADSAARSSPWSSVSQAALPELVLPDKPSIVVIPFRNLGDPADNFFSDGITEDIITALCCFRELFVIAGDTSLAFRERGMEPTRFARELGVEFLLQGSVRRSGDRIRVGAQLLDAATGRQIWGERYDRTLHDIFSVQDEISQTLGANLAGRIESIGRERALRKSTHSLDAYDYLLRGNRYLWSYTKDDIAQARLNLEKAIALDPGYATAHAHLAWTYFQEWDYPWLSESPSEALDRALELAHQAVALDEADVWGHCTIHWPYLHKKEYELAEKHLERASRLNPNHPFVCCSKSWFLTLTGRPSDGIECGKTSYRQNPFFPEGCLAGIGIAHYVLEEYENALTMFKMVQEPARTAWDHAFMAACYAQLDRAGDAKSAAERAAALWDGIKTHDWPRNWPFQRQSDLDHLLEGLRKAGLIA